MGLEDRESGFPRARVSLRPLLLTHDVFFGELQASRSLDGITLSHRIADSPPEEVEVHTHVEAHFVLVTSGRYVSSARATPNRRMTLVYNPPRTTHRDHFDQGKGSFFTISVSTERLAESNDSELPSLAVCLSDERACGLATALLMECPRWDPSSSLKAESLYSELLAAAAHKTTPAEQSRPTGCVPLTSSFTIAAQKISAFAKSRMQSEFTQHILPVCFVVFWAARREICCVPDAWRKRQNCFC